MNPNRLHIIRYQNHLWISQPWLIDHIQVSEKYLERVRYGKDTQDRETWQYIRLDSMFFYRLDTIPKASDKLDMARVQAEATDYNTGRLNDIKTEFKHQINELVDTSLSLYYQDYGYDLTKATELAIAYGVIRFAREATAGTMYKELELPKMQLWELLCEVARELCPHRLNYDKVRSFMNRLKKLPTDTEELKAALVDGRKNNENSRKFGKSSNKLVNTHTGEVFDYCAHELLIYGLWVNMGGYTKLTKQQVFDDYTVLCEQYQLEPVSLGTVKSYINKNRHWLALERHGLDVYTEKYSTYISRRQAEYSGSIWAIDWSGTKINYLDKDGYIKTGYMIRIVDLAEHRIIGWEVIPRKITQKKGNGVKGGEPGWETHPAMSIAFGRAVEYTGGYGCVEMVTDNGGAFTSAESKRHLKALCQQYRQIAIGNKQANKAERIVREFSQFSRQLPNWANDGFRAHFTSEENLNKPYTDMEKDELRKFLPNWDEMYQQVSDLVAKFNSERGKEVKRLKGLKKLTDRELRQAFGTHTSLGFGNSRGVVQVKLNGYTHRFDVYDYDALLQKVASLTSDKAMTVKVIWDESAADLYNLGDKYIDTLLPLEQSHGAIAEATDSTRRGYRTQKAKKQLQLDKAQSRTAELGGALADMDYSTALVNTQGSGKVVQLAQLEELEDQQEPANNNDNPDDIVITDDLIEQHIYNNR